MSFIIIVAGRVFSDSTAMRVRSQNMLKSSEEIGKVANLISEDISQMGVKEWWGQTNDNEYKKEVYWDENKDFSSYELIRTELPDNVYADKLTFLKAVFNDAGEFSGVLRITWYTKEKSLFRKCEVKKDIKTSSSLNDCRNNPDVLIATDIANFKLTPYRQVQDILFENFFHLYPRLSSGAGINDPNIRFVTPDNLVNPSGAKMEVSGFEKNSSETDKRRYEFYLAKYTEDLLNSYSWINCEKLPLKKDSGKIVIEFKMPFTNDQDKAEKYYNSTQFMHGKDHLSIGFRKNNGERIPDAPDDILFYPPQSGEAKELKRHLEFSVKKNVEDACVAITFAFYSPTAYLGTYAFSDFKVFRKAEHFQPPLPEKPNYGIGNDDTVEKRDEKKSVKAFELILEINHKGEKAGTFSQKGTGIIIATPNNGIEEETE